MILYDDQIEAINSLKPGSILCGGVGSGKSISALAFYYIKICKGNIGKDFCPMKEPLDLIIITTARKRDTLEWNKELLPFSLSPNNPKQKIKVIIDSWNNIKKYETIKNSFFIFDEQRLVGFGKWTKSFFKIAKENLWVLLTATPGDVWMDYAPVFIANNMYKNKTDFENRHVIFNWSSKFKLIDHYVGINTLIENKNKIIVYMKYKSAIEKKSEYIITYYDKKKYDYIKIKRWNIYDDKPVENISELCYLLRKVSNSDPSKLSELEKIIEKHMKVIVFYNFNYELDLLKKFAEENEIIYSEWNGKKHEEIPKAKKYIYLVQYTSGAEGWNCTSVDCICFFSLNYSYRIMTQAAGRIDRRNSKIKKVYYYYLLSNSKIDSSILSAINSKKTFNITNFINSREKHRL